ncbi:helix-turn-helix transcriptional regulator [Pelistega suis]|uniref:helix-turn-helix transcriptional regulator n=1 Tax=Pelistega suis TaxID=1631957 RepID=UPI00211CBC5C|nr:helix-turn-helix transcriptional regulator [Pelistega suis]MCQ9329507.1 helix-turn-helix transcriptional regulator [Pelistega suis]
MPTAHLNSEQFIHLLNQKNNAEWVAGNYTFHTLQSGLSIHGGLLKAHKNMQCSRLVDSYINFIILLKGTLRFSINHQNYCIPADNGKIIMVSLPQESLFTRYLVKDESCEKVAIKGIEKWLLQYPQQKIPSNVFDETVRIWHLPDSLKTISQFFLSPPNTTLHGKLIQEANTIQLLAMLWEIFEKSSDYLEQWTVKNQDNQFTQHLNKIFQPALSVKDLAKSLNISERTLQRRLQEHFGLSVSDWLRHKKMKFALYSLKHTGLSIGEISYACGYKHVSNFTQAFKNYFDCTPAEAQNSYK